MWLGAPRIRMFCISLSVYNINFERKKHFYKYILHTLIPELVNKKMWGVLQCNINTYQSKLTETFTRKMEGENISAYGG